METRQYIEVPTYSKDDEKDEQSWKYFFRQLFVSSVMWTPFFAVGICLGTPTVFIPQVRREANSTAIVSVEMVSWLSSAFGYMSVPWCFILAYLSSYIGRKKTLIIISLNQILVATSLYLTITPTHLLITILLQGLTHASSMTVCVISIVEYVSPTNRAVLLPIKSATIYWSILATNAIGAFVHWRYITVLSFSTAIYSLTAFFCPESPTWLASRGRYEECRRSHRWLKGSSDGAEKELEVLINTQIEERKVPKKNSLKNTLSFFVDKQFYGPVLLSTTLMLMYQLSGKQVVTIYAIDIVKHITSSESTAYKTMLIMDAVSVLAMYTGCAIAKLFKRRTLLLTFGSCTVLFLLALSLYLYLAHLSYFPENKYISVGLLVAFSISIGLGPLVLATSVYGELIAVKYKSQSTVVIACVFVILQGVLLKNTPSIIKAFDMHGMFMFYGLSVTVCMFILYKYLPETKDKTLQEIEEYFKD